MISHYRDSSPILNGLLPVRGILATAILVVHICLLLLPSQAKGFQDIIWVTVEGSAPLLDDNLEQARELAIEIAERKAIEEVVVSNISLETLLVNLKLSGTMIGAIPHGEIVESEIIEESDSNNLTIGESASSSMYSVKMKVGVVENVSGYDPEFRIAATLNQTQFVDGEKMQIHLQSTKDCFYCVFILLEDQKVLKLIPNQFRTNNFLESNVAYTIPDDEDRKKGIVLKVQTPENKAVVKEAVYVLALKQPFDFEDADIQEGIFGIYNGQTAFLEVLIREIVRIPLGDRAEMLIQYQISKAKANSSS